MKRINVDIIVGTRPNFMKAAAIFSVPHTFNNLYLRLIHTGQHYDAEMVDIFFEQFKLPAPVCCLEVGSGTHAVQTGEIMKRYEQWVQNNRPDLCLVVGDVNSTAACAIVCAKERIRLGHVEAGLRSFDRSMPEEINRIITDSIAELLFASEPSAVQNLRREGHGSYIYFVGNVMIDTLFRMRPQVELLSMHRNFGLKKKGYAFVTLHRPSNVDDPHSLKEVCEQLKYLSERMPVVFPIHPRTRKYLQLNGWEEKFSAMAGFHLLDPIGYLESLSLVLDSQLVITDSGGLQEETTVLNIPCLTFRDNTERPITIEQGTNTLIKRNWNLFRECLERIERGTYLQSDTRIPLWDGHAAERILKICSEQ